MTLTVQCPECGRRYPVKGGIGGAKVACRACKHVFMAHPEGASAGQESTGASTGRKQQEIPSFQVACPSCGSRYKAPGKMKGKAVACPTCQHAFTASPDTGTAARTVADAFDELFDDVPLDNGTLGSSLPSPPGGSSSSPARPHRSRKSSTGAAAKEYVTAIGVLGVGVLSILGGIIASVASYRSPDSEGGYFVYWGAVVVGLFMTGRGIVGLIRATEMKITGESQGTRTRTDRIVRSIKLRHVVIALILLAIIIVVAVVLVDLTRVARPWSTQPSPPTGRGGSRHDPKDLPETAEEARIESERRSREMEESRKRQNQQIEEEKKRMEEEVERLMQEAPDYGAPPR